MCVCVSLQFLSCVYRSIYLNIDIFSRFVSYSYHPWLWDTQRMHRQQQRRICYLIFYHPYASIILSVSVQRPILLALHSHHTTSRLKMSGTFRCHPLHEGIKCLNYPTLGTGSGNAYPTRWATCKLPIICPSRKAIVTAHGSCDLRLLPIFQKILTKCNLLQLQLLKRLSWLWRPDNHLRTRL